VSEFRAESLDLCGVDAELDVVDLVAGEKDICQPELDLPRFSEMYVQSCKTNVPSGTLWKAPGCTLQGLQAQALPAILMGNLGTDVHHFSIIRNPPM
jgi:hypothetical protein